MNEYSITRHFVANNCLYLHPNIQRTILLALQFACNKLFTCNKFEFNFDYFFMLQLAKNTKKNENGSSYTGIRKLISMVPIKVKVSDAMTTMSQSLTK